MDVVENGSGCEETFEKKAVTESVHFPSFL